MNSGKTSLVGGARSRLGGALAAAEAQRGERVLATGRNAEALDRRLEELDAARPWGADTSVASPRRRRVRPPA
jgi:NAD(P)-dependent dehydrogenase (short-subunit alcohol dehydrogenase family)